MEHQPKMYEVMICLHDAASCLILFCIEMYRVDYIHRCNSLILFYIEVLCCVYYSHR